MHVRKGSPCTGKRFVYARLGSSTTTTAAPLPLKPRAHEATLRASLATIPAGAVSIELILWSYAKRPWQKLNGT